MAQTPLKPAAHRFPCPSCSAGMQFDPTGGGLKCPYCGTTQAVPDDVRQSVRELPYSEYSKPRLEKITADALQVSCATCGSVVQFEPPEVAGTCPFCAAAIVMQPKAADPLVAPHGVLPFSLAPDQAQRSIKSWIGSLWFAPNALQKLARPEGVNGVYIPFWTFDANTTTHYVGEHGEHYYESEQYVVMVDGRQQVRTRNVIKTRWRPASGVVENSFDDVLVPATKAVNRDRLSALDPWGPEPVRAYEPAYLAGFKAQRYQIDLPAGLEDAKERMKGAIHQSCCADIGGDEQRVHDMRIEHRDITFKHILLPVWIGAYRFQGKLFQVLVNARTGEVQGDRPYSAAKIALAVLAALIGLLVLAVLNRS